MHPFLVNRIIHIPFAVINESPDEKGNGTGKVNNNGNNISQICINIDTESLI